MSDQHFREIQLSGKQLVFLFMASVVLAVSIFLLGVSVGRGVPGTAGPASALNEPAPPAELTPPDVMPPPTEISERDSAFEQLLPGEAPGERDTPVAAGTGRDTTASEAPPNVNEPVNARAAADPPPAAEPEPVRQTTAARPGTEAPAAARATPAGQFTVQVNAYRSRASADREAASLKQKGYDAYVDSSGSSGLYRVRIGAYPNRDEANRIAARLRQEGISSLVTR